MDVARRAGVGKVTVSYVLNGHSRAARISEETQQRVLQAVAELDYRPNALARMLVKKQTDAIAVVFQSGGYFTSLSGFTSEVMRGVCSACVEADIDLMLHTRPANDPIQEAQALMDGRVDGVLMLRDGGDPMMAEVIRRRFPLVLFFTRSDDPNVPFVDTDNYTGGKIATNHLLDLGHKRIGMLAGGTGSIASNDRFNGFRSALESRGVPFNPGYVVRIADPSGEADFKQLMTLPKRPTALFAWSDDDAFQSFRYLEELGLRVPEDVSVVGYDNSTLSERSNPPLTSVQQPVFEMAKTATQMIVQITRSEVPDQPRLIFVPEIVIRKSTSLIRN